uniref:RNA polymerase sigma factor n=1 Tax=Pedobacter schmidteae TaxID=2201271 RepID=UPI000EAE1500|nr:sigma-70 family RNA polymerase sigma factor [Pedobacter schmidteae]
MAAKFSIEISDKAREGWLTALYQKVFPSVAKHIGRMGGSFEEARDIFQDALVIYYERLKGAKLELRNSEEAYLFGIARHLWHKRYQQNSKQQSIDQLSDAFEERTDLNDPDYTEVSSSRLLKLLQSAGQKCMQLLSAFYYEKLDMDHLAQRFGFSGPRSATVQKFKCLEKVKETVKEKSIQYEDIFE